MPTINEYKDESGFFILARPSDVGNITYQVSTIAEEIFRKLGYEDGDDVDWRTIQALKVAKLVYTGEQGVDDSHEVDFVAEIQDSIEDITEKQARTLLDELRERASLSDSQLKEVEGVLGVRTQSRLERLESNLKQAILDAGQRGELKALALSDYEFIIDISDLRESTENGFCNISLTGALDGTFDEEPYQHGIFVCQEHGVEGWRCRSDFDESWEFKAEMYKQMGTLLPILIAELDAVGIEIGTPESSPPPEVGRWEFS